MSQAAEQIARQFANANLNKRTWGDLIYNVKVYGAKGDGSTDDAEAIKKAIDDINQNGGGVLFFPKGVYVISETIVIHTNTIVRGENFNTTTIKCSGTFNALYESAIVFRNIKSVNHCDAVSMYDISLNTNHRPVHGITGFSVYDGAVFMNVVVDGLEKTHSAYRFIPHEGLLSVDPVSQTILMMNCMGYVGENGATAPVFYFEAVQEMTLVGCKAFSGRSYPQVIVSDSPCYEFASCRGVTMIGCSAGGSPSSVYPIRILVTYRDSNGFYIAGTTFEACHKLLEVKGTASNYVDNVTFVGSRSEGMGVMNPTIKLEYVRDSNIEVLIGIPQFSNVFTSIVRKTEVMQLIDDIFYLYYGGVNILKAEYPWSGPNTSLFLLVNDGTNTSLRRIEVGEADSGGAGYRVLRVPN